jgi:hypothetical protein
MSRLEPQLPADAQPVALAVPAGSRIGVRLLAANIGRRRRGHDPVQQAQDRGEQLFHEPPRVSGNSSSTYCSCRSVSSRVTRARNVAATTGQARSSLAAT